MLPMGSVFKKHKVLLHCFADNVQIYLPVTTNDSHSAVKMLQDCLREVQAWLRLNFLNLNKDKNEILVFGQSNPLHGHDSVIGPLSPYCHPLEKNLGVMVDHLFKFDKHICIVIKAGFFQLRTLANFKSYLPRADFERAIHAFITSRYYYCNYLYIGLDQGSLQHLQSVHNAAAPLLTRTKRRESITPVLCILHWLPVGFRVKFKVSLIVFKCLNSMGPSYLSELLQPYTPPRALRSADQLLLAVPKARLKTRGDRAPTSVAAPRLWNSLSFV